MEQFFRVFLHYLYEVVPALLLGFGISGIVHELIPEELVLKHLGSRGLRPVLYATVIGTILPICCMGSLPVAVSFHKKGARLGPILAFLVATPATSISALLVAYNVIGLEFAVYIFFAVIAMGIATGLVGNLFPYRGVSLPAKSCPHCVADPAHAHAHARRTLTSRITAALRYAYVELPKEIGFELVIGLALAALVATVLPLRDLVGLYLGGPAGYLFSVVFGILMYLCSTASVPLVDSLVRSGMSAGAGMTLLLIGPVTSYGTILVLRKEYGARVLAAFLATIIAASLLLGVGYGFLIGR